MDPARLLYGSRSPIVIGGLLGFWLGAFASLLVMVIYAALFRFEIGSLTPMFAMAFGAPIGVIVGTVVAVAVRRKTRP